MTVQCAEQHAGASVSQSVQFSWHPAGSSPCHWMTVPRDARISFVGVHRQGLKPQMFSLNVFSEPNEVRL